MQRFLDWLDEYLADVGFVGAAEVGFGILSVCGVFGLVFALESAESISVAAVLVGVAGLTTLVIAGRSSSRRRAEVDQKLLVRYCEVLSDQMQSSWRLIRWEQHTDINPQGDVRQVMSASGAVKSFKLSYYRIRVGAGWNQPKKYRNNVRVHVRGIELEGVPGAQAELTTVWLPSGRLEVLVHFPKPLSRGKRFNVVVVVDWPGKCRPLMKDGAPDDFRYVASRHLEELAYTVVLPPGTDATCGPLGFVPEEEPDYSLEERRGNGQLEVEFRALNVKPNRIIGMRLDLK
ncbi:hypothetical protein BBK82_15545 [Lentzea guizhouensis]|uniref:Uncharacterized protein n=1 Tax=Lentzea guizhouensis TaxID=1586287 RepID=A0A1B2HHT0_9PSEU|nr:hypothetical protein [Lentzea guizhouensis]ANZ37266.1 hypothetical protein BBK82_15545 [Lentzea guizhouensis]